jgi:hypothetical protein
MSDFPLRVHPSPMGFLKGFMCLSYQQDQEHQCCYVFSPPLMLAFTPRAKGGSNLHRQACQV